MSLIAVCVCVCMCVCVCIEGVLIYAIMSDKMPNPDNIGGIIYIHMYRDNVDILILTTKVWQRPVGYLEVQVIFRKRATNYRALLWKMTYEDKASYGSSPPCNWGSYIQIG